MHFIADWIHYVESPTLEHHSACNNAIGVGWSDCSNERAYNEGSEDHALGICIAS